MGFIAFIFSLIKRLVTGTPGTETTNSYDANGNTTTNAYDISGRLTTTTDALNNVVSYGYNVEDLMTSLTYTKGGTSVPTIYTYNDQHRLVRTDQPGYDITNPTGVITNTTYTGYDANGNVTSRTDGAGVNIQYAFDNINRMITKTYPNLSTVSTSYDAVSNLINISDTNTSTANEFDSLNRLTKVTDYMYNPAMAIDYSYYNDGVRKTLSQSGSTVTYTYDKARRLKSIAIAGMPGNISGYDYNALGQRTKETLVNGATVTYTYDSTTRWLTLVSNSTSTSALISSFVYTHDKVGNRVTMAGYNGGSSGAFTYTYNANYRLITETLVSGGMTLQTDYYYDEPGNRTRMSKNSGETTLYAYNNANQCISWTNPSGVCFTDKYNGAGSLITETNTASGVMQEWGFDYEGHQTVYSTTGTSAAYKIDAMGRRISKTVNGTTEYYFYDGANVFYDIFGPNSYRVYITAGLDQPVWMMTSQMAMYYYLQDGLGSVVNLLDSSQSVVNTYIYGTFGDLIVDSEIVPQRYKFTGREWDSESGTQHSRERQYRPTWGRFTRRDPIGYEAGINLYTYCDNNPGNYVDPWGLWQLKLANNNFDILAIAEHGDRLSELFKRIGGDFNNVLTLIYKGKEFGSSSPADLIKDPFLYTGDTFQLYGSIIPGIQKYKAAKFNKYDRLIQFWCLYWRYDRDKEIDPSLIKAMAFVESTLGNNPAAGNDILQVIRGGALENLAGRADKKGYEWHDDGTETTLNYDIPKGLTEGTINVEDSIKWGIRWLFYKAHLNILKDGKKTSDWKSWSEAIQLYNGTGADAEAYRNKVITIFSTGETVDGYKLFDIE